MSSTLVLRVVTKAMVPVMAVYSVYLLVRGHDAVGGGFIGGLVAGAALVLQFFAGGGQTPRAASRPLDLLGVGLLISVGYGLVGLLAGGSFLGGAVWYPALPLLGEVKVAASLVFDLGVFLLVVAAMGAVLRFLGEGAA